ncbi:MAG: hypothetical protein ABL984_07065 [Pyrinomonadaceae bacterium]
MIHILYTPCHKDRAEALATATPGSTHGLIDPAQLHGGAVNPAKPLHFGNLETLVLWGHGDSSGICGLHPSQVVKLIKKWKDANSKLKNVELLTCNARHSSTGTSLTAAVKSGLRSNIFSSAHGIKIKALPVAVGGPMNAWSILLAEPMFQSWAYITAPGANDNLMQTANTMMKFHLVGGKSVSYKGSLIDRAQKIMVENPVRNWTINYGHLTGLRKSLVEV